MTDRAGRRPAVMLSGGGTSRELQELLANAGEHSVVGCLDDAPDTPGRVGSFAELDSYIEAGHRIFATFGSAPRMRQRASLLQRVPDSSLRGFAHASAVRYHSAQAGPGMLMFPMAVLSHNARVGRAVLLYHAACVSHDACLGDHTIVANHGVVSGACKIGASVYIGANATVLEGREVGSGSIVAAGATVVRDVPPKTIYIAPGDTRPNHYWAEDDSTSS